MGELIVAVIGSESSDIQLYENWANRACCVMIVVLLVMPMEEINEICYILDSGHEPTCRR